ncbi:Rossmann-like and DUF2520 domain-containing protein [Flavobacterium rhizosphaerae]|uniref:DUF2520 domain-containing protein n=1 Tax=Flavobacterium rhizosphaerae TaxID=3163298 RepID=A0ABW8YVR8_9FLAO
MLKVVVIGSGNVGQHLIKALKAVPDVLLLQAFSRHPEKLDNILVPEQITDNITNLVDADLYIIAVKDDAVMQLSSQLNFTDKLVVHTSGSLGLEAIDNKNRGGVFYPLQTFSVNREINFNTVPFCLEAENETDYTILKELASKLSKNVYNVNSAQRQALHVAAVFVNNFTNHMYTIGSKICDDNSLPFDILKPLIQETAFKIQDLPPTQAQTGPAIRNDILTIQKHVNFLTNEKIREIYILLSQSIQANAEKL